MRPGLLGAEIELLGTRFGVDALGAPFLVVTLVLWAAAFAFAVPYLRGDRRRGRFLAAFAVAMAGNVAVTLAQDVVSFYAAFALMSFASYPLVVHQRTRRAARAGRVYLTLVVLGEALIFAGLAVAAAAGGGGLGLAPQPADGALGATLIALGFGIKTGLVPLHVWLPLAHPVAPTPASAVLSGAMLKAGLLGWLRFLPLGGAPLEPLGAALVGLGLLAAPLAALTGVVQRDAKTQLAYSSVSQMGLMTAAVGAALLDPALAAAATGAAVLLAMHHALAKGALFLGVGVVQRSAAGAARRRALLLLAVPALVLAGAPFTSGMLGKAALGAVLGRLPGGLAPVGGAGLTLSAVTTALLLGRVLLGLATARPEGGSAADGLWRPWVALVAASALAPRLARAFVAAAAWPPAPGLGDLGLAVALPGIGAALAVALMRRGGADRPTLPDVPAGDLLRLWRPLRRAWRALRGTTARPGLAARAGARLEIAVTPWRGRLAAAVAWAAAATDRLEQGVVRATALGAALLVVLAVLRWA